IVTAHSVEMPVGTIQEGVAGLLHRALGNPVAEAPAKLIFFNTEYEKIGEPMALESASDTAYVLNAGGTVDTTLLTEGSTQFASAQTRAEIEQILATLEIDDQILLETDEAAVVFLKTNDGFFHQYKAPQPIV